MTTTITSASNSPQPKRPHWLDTLPPAPREAVYAEMRALGDLAEHHRQEHMFLRPKYGETAVGAAHMDPFFRTEAIHEFLRALRQGERPKGAGHAAHEAVANAVRLHNQKRPRDQAWQRWEDTCEGLILSMIVRMTAAGGETDR